MKNKGVLGIILEISETNWDDDILNDGRREGVVGILPKVCTNIRYSSIRESGKGFPSSGSSLSKDSEACDRVYK